MYKFSIKSQKVPLIKTKNRIIITPIPSSETVKIINQGNKFGSGLPLGQLPVAWHKAVGFNVFDKAGNKWIDFTSTIFVANIGHSNHKIKQAIQGQLNKDLIHAYNYPTDIKNKFMSQLILMSKPYFDKALLFSAGTEAIECILAIMRINGYKKNKHKTGIISFQNSMHGVTAGSQTLRNNKSFMKISGLRGANVYHLPFPFVWSDHKTDWAKQFKKDIQGLKRKGMKGHNICGIILEGYQGWGALFYPKSYIRELVKFAKQNKILIAVDEIQSGCGRTGKMFAFEHYGLKPDLVALGKGLSSSLPLSAVLGSRKLLSFAEDLDVAHSTHSGNPLSCAAGLANLKEIKSLNLVRESERKGKILYKTLCDIQKKHPDIIAHINGRGLVAAVLFKNLKTGRPDSEFASRVCEKAMQKGLLLVHTGRESIKIAPPLTIPDAALREGIKVLEESLEEVAEK